MIEIFTRAFGNARPRKSQKPTGASISAVRILIPTPTPQSIPAPHDGEVGRGSGRGKFPFQLVGQHGDPVFEPFTIPHSDLVTLKIHVFNPQPQTLQ